ncbi:N-acyl homoserine lactonase family protein [Pseudonocardia sp. NPDC046786]|uniref:N-acyl homoserine lactonase family protein n=1 Tax=Pseudonocardia sp. NPDC046786 TaxID=3155471 RepID=UPI0033C66578
MSDTTGDKIKVTILPTGTMHADLTWLLIDPSRMATHQQPAKQRDWVEVPTHVVHVEHPNGQKLMWDAGVPRDWETRWAPSGLGQFFPVDAASEDDWLDSRLRQLKLEPTLELDTISADTELMPGVTLLRTPGHTWGTMSLQVDLADSGTMIFASDSLYLKESYGPPPIAAGIVYDTVAWFESVDKIRAIQERTGATVVFGHDANQIRELRTGPGNHYT